ncbi:hypothetical protein C8R44DRAFT_748434 [Mycena epipterygia]|nr:hypothetical protein C8R44DRAFT_748434 [Mycena epipterygia]
MHGERRRSAVQMTGKPVPFMFGKNSGRAAAVLRHSFGPEHKRRQLEGMHLDSGLGLELKFAVQPMLFCSAVYTLRRRMGKESRILVMRGEEKGMEINLHGAIAPPNEDLFKELDVGIRNYTNEVDVIDDSHEVRLASNKNCPTLGPEQKKKFHVSVVLTRESSNPATRCCLKREPIGSILKDNSDVVIRAAKSHYAALAVHLVYFITPSSLREVKLREPAHAACTVPFVCKVAILLSFCGHTDGIRRGSDVVAVESLFLGLFSPRMIRRAVGGQTLVFEAEADKKKDPI